MSGNAYSYIYALIDPRDDEVRYIGKANDVMARFNGHLRDSTRRRSKVYAWILELVSEGMSPIVATVDRVLKEQWEDAERFYIAEFKRCGFDLLNISSGGNEPQIKAHVNAENGRKTAKAIHSNPLRKKIWHLKREMGLLLKQGHVKESTKEKLRAAAKKRPDLFGCWASI